MKYQRPHEGSPLMNHLCWTVLNYNRHRRAIPRGDAEVEDESTWHERRGSTRAINTAVILFEWPIRKKNIYVITLSIRRRSSCNFPQISYFQTAVNVYQFSSSGDGKSHDCSDFFKVMRLPQETFRQQAKNITFIVSTVFSKNIFLSLSSFCHRRKKKRKGEAWLAAPDTDVEMNRWSLKLWNKQKQKSVLHISASQERQEGRYLTAADDSPPKITSWIITRGKVSF